MPYPKLSLYEKVFNDIYNYCQEEFTCHGLPLSKCSDQIILNDNYYNFDYNQKMNGNNKNGFVQKSICIK